ncbi:hypothetical protein GTP41_00840 [Pseudoduganella sp. DS3]|uniref:Uncharacterized protein n=1 Tax=Pseudoduganella guangdongensis TaxID=2692179 RepID=A0A6N9HBN9_9BURK|nr:hypothetical protein [Pseudoduganella guangdongensis]MYN00637.1 hypothetical protein [Pseudoduganella guangdongensis]
MERERAKAGDAVRPLGWHNKMLVIRTTPGRSGLGDDDDVLCRWHDRAGEHEQTFKSGQLEVLNSAAQARNPRRRTLI